MTPKEKAEELINKFIPHTKVFHEVLGWEEYIDSAKQCALIAVDEILNEIPTEILDTYKGETNFIINERFKFWEQVKAEIERL